jgi:D-amino peptidase
MVRYSNVLIVADIEGTSNCWSYEASRLFDPDWPGACVGMTLDVDAVCRALFDTGVKTITVKDFHRTGFNILPELMDPRVNVVQGYIKGPVPGMGNPNGAQAVLFVGLHAATREDGFLGHTLTSRIRRLEVNGRVITEAELFSGSLAGFGVKPIFFSGDIGACRQAESAIPKIKTFALDKSNGFVGIDIDSWRRDLGQATVDALNNGEADVFLPQGPFSAKVYFRDGEIAAAKAARPWKLAVDNDAVLVEALDFDSLYMALIRLAYLNPLTDRFSKAALGLFNLWGRVGLAWVRRRIRKGATHV